MTWLRRISTRTETGGRIAAIGALVALGAAAGAYVALIAVGIAQHVLSGGAA